MNRLCRLRMTTQSPIANGQANDCQPKRNGNLRHEVESRVTSIRGAMCFILMEFIMPTSTKGAFPVKDGDAAADGFAGIAPIKQYKPNSYGLYDMSGNVWEWTSDWYRPDYYRLLKAENRVAKNPLGPTTSFDPAELALASGCTEVALSCVATCIATATCSVRVAKVTR